MGRPSRQSLHRREKTPRRTRHSTGASGPVRQALGPKVIAELESLCGAPSVGLRDVAYDVGAIVVAAVTGSLLGHVVGPLLAMLYIGVRQRHLSNLAHECVHAKLLVTARGNRLVGYLLTGMLGEGLRPYRATHGVHHAQLGSGADPMFQSYQAGRLHTVRAPMSRASFVLRVIVKAALWRLPTSAVRVLVTRGPRESRWAPAARAVLWAGVAAVFWSFGVLGELLLYWLVPLVFVRPVVTWITDLGNHAGLIHNRDDVLVQTRGWSSHWLTRHLLGGHLDDMYHPVHHWCPKIPWRRLPEATALLSERVERWDEVPWCSGYFFRRRSTPEVPCVIEDVVTRLTSPPARRQAVAAEPTAA
ncbi:fatty acid desaturase [Streptomyces sp. CS7]|uniref:fatty acid desaturase family protein n=1 Tax=Streptomyces sp. CS-7 TaxID=2906769 RepID=UPI0021B49F28|nr:fatty acid desaturase [Streptomyces sp. CS-7]MCT6780541.1 fatty acid desaturase [Streptomyces sp. CS-7]